MFLPGSRRSPSPPHPPSKAQSSPPIRVKSLSAEEPQRILIRATNWLGDAVMSLPALRAVHERFPSAQITLLAIPWVADLYKREPFAHRVWLLRIRRGLHDLGAKWTLSRDLAREKFDWAILLPNSFESASLAFLSRIPIRLGYDRDARGRMLTHPVPVPQEGVIPRHQSFYYLELLRRAGLIDSLPSEMTIRLEGLPAARAAGLAMLEKFGARQPVIGVSPGAAYGGAKRWLPERFAEAAARLYASLGGTVVVFGAPQEVAICHSVSAMLREKGVQVIDVAGRTRLAEFVDMASACRVFLTNDSGSMHIASAVGVPTVAVFGATDDAATGPTGPLAAVVREPVECSPCLLRECPIDHRCMTRVSAEHVAETAFTLLK